MSLCIALQDENMIMIAGDSRAAIEENGVFYHISDEFPKIHPIADKIIFTSGSGDIVSNIIEIYKKSDDQSIETLKNISINCVTEFNKKHSGVFPKEKRLVELLVACFENGRSVIYNISSHDNYKILRVEGNKHRNTITLGCHTDEALELINKYRSKIETTELIKFVYDTLADEQLGGMLNLYIMTKKGIMYFQKYEIKDTKILSRAIVVDDIFVHANATDGIKIQIRPTILSGEEPSGHFWSNAVDQLKIDIDGNLLLAGKIQTGNNFSVDINGNLTATSANITGAINCTSLKINNTDVMNQLNTLASSVSNSQLNGSILQAGSVNVSKIDVTSLYVGTGGIRLDSSATLSWNQVTNQPVIPTTALQVGALPADSPKLTKLTSTGLYTGNIEATNVILGNGSNGGSVNFNAGGSYASFQMEEDWLIGKNLTLGYASTPGATLSTLNKFIVKGTVEATAINSPILNGVDISNGLVAKFG